MIFRKILATFFVFLFVIVSLPTFLIYGLSRTYFSGSFYQGEIANGLYNNIVESAANYIYNQDETIQKYFQQSDLKKEIQNVFTPEMFKEISGDFGKQLENLKENPNAPMTMSLKIFRESLLTVSHNLAYNLFQSFPICKSKELPEVDEKGIPTCVPKGADYKEISGPISKQFEKTIYNFSPEQLQIDLISTKNHNPTFYYVFSLIDKSKIYLLAALLILMVIIASILYYPFATMIQYEGIAFLFSGTMGFLLSIIMTPLIFFSLNDYDFSERSNELQQNIFSFSSKENFQHFLEYLISFLTTEIQKISFVFAAIGILLLIIHFAIKKRKFPT